MITSSSTVCCFLVSVSWLCTKVWQACFILSLDTAAKARTASVKEANAIVLHSIAAVSGYFFFPFFFDDKSGVKASTASNIKFDKFNIIGISLPDGEAFDSAVVYSALHKRTTVRKAACKLNAFDRNVVNVVVVCIDDDEDDEMIDL